MNVAVKASVRAGTSDFSERNELNVSIDIAFFVGKLRCRRANYVKKLYHSTLSRAIHNISAVGGR